MKDQDPDHWDFVLPQSPACFDFVIPQQFLECKDALSAALPEKGIMEILRRTGRSSRMLAAALELALSGEVVYIVGLRIEGRNSLIGRIEDILLAANVHYQHPRVEKIIFDSKGEILVIGSNDRMLDLDQMVIHGVSRSKIFIDPSVLESKYSNILSELHRYDPPFYGESSFDGAVLKGV